MTSACVSLLRRQCPRVLLEIDCTLSGILTRTGKQWWLRRDFCSANSIEYSKSRNSYEKSLSDLRKEWSKEFESKRKLAAEKAAARAREIEEHKATRDALEDEEALQKREALRLRQDQERREKMALKASKRAENLHRESVRQAILDSMRDERKNKLLEESRYWIGTEEELIDAVDRAVEKVEPLYVSQKVNRRIGE